MLPFGTIIFLGAFLLFEVQPLIAKLLLPWFGGSAAVWITCMLFFQTALVLGYLVAFLSRRLLAPRGQAWAHALALLASLALLPIAPAAGWKPTSGDEPMGRILLLLVRFVGAPYALLAASGPLLQSWFVDRHPGRSPYRLFALSNLASLLAVVAYPLAIEPRWSSREQARLWTWGYAGFVGLGVLVAARQALRPAPARRDPHAGADDVAAPSWGTLFVWLALPACASAQLLAVTNHVTEDIAAMPLLWIVPLALYLLSFVLCFEVPGVYKRRVFVPLLAVALVAMGYFRRPDALHVGLWWQVAIFSVGLFVVCMVCHGEVARRKPQPSRLAGFYLLVATGGAVGGVGVGLVAPRVFAYTAELDLGLVACAALAAFALLFGGGAGGDERRRRLFIVAAAYVLGLLVFVGLSLVDVIGDARLVVRNAYGSLRESDGTSSVSGDPYRKLAHGHVTHGAQWLTPARRREPTTYYCPTSGAGLALGEHNAGRPRAVGVIGLGTGTLAAYARPGDRWRFYDINPLIIEIAQRDFTFLADSGADIEIVGGDARLSLEREPPQGFDVLVVDAFAGDAIPVHLLTREAFALYFGHLEADGVLAVHISNRNLDLLPVVAEAAAHFHKQARLVATDDSEDDGACFSASWVVVTGDGDLFERPAFARAIAVEPTPGLRAWTDDYASLLPLLE